MTRVHLYGASGYAAAEALSILRSHPRVEIGVLESASHAGEPVGVHFPQLRRLPRAFDGAGTLLDRLDRNEVVILGGSHGVAKTIAPQLLERGARVIDLSGDFRVSPTPAVYGYAERYRDRIAASRFVANPGCYPTATLLATLPLAPFAPKHIVIDAKSGITGAGRTPAVGSLFAEVSNDVRAYGLNGHRHEPEIIEQWRAIGMDASLIFTPHVVPIARGMLVDAYCFFAAPLDAAAVQRAFREAYERNPFVRVLDDGIAPALPAVAGTNDAEMAISVFRDAVRVICAIDNLGRGAAAQAVRNLNIMCGYPEELGLRAHALTR